MSNNRSARLASLVGWLAMAGAVAVLPVIVVSAPDRSPYFWHRIAWTEFLTLVVWAYFGGFIFFVFPRGRIRSAVGGLLPSTGLVVGIYALLSFMLMIVMDWPSRFHWAGQTVLFVLVVLLFTFFEYARAGASVGAERLPVGLRSPAELCAIIRLQEEKLWSSVASPPLAGEDRKLHDSLKALREAIQYSIQHVGKIGGSQDYSVFVADVERLCAELQTAPTSSPEPTSWRATAEDLARRANYISATLKVRPA
jgi:hypothetical protein